MNTPPADPPPPPFAAGQVVRNLRSGRYWQVLRLGTGARGTTVAAIRLLGGNRRVGWLHADAIGAGWRVEHRDVRVIGCGRCAACEQGMVASCHAPAGTVDTLDPPRRGTLQEALRRMVAGQGGEDDG